MLRLEINGDSYRLFSDTKRQQKLKAELLSRYPGDVEVTITDKAVVIDHCLLEDLFCSPIECIRNAGLTLPGK